MNDKFELNLLYRLWKSDALSTKEYHRYIYLLQKLNKKGNK